MRPGARGLHIASTFKAHWPWGQYVWLLFVSFRQSRPALVQTIAFSVHFQNADVVDQSVQQSASETFRAEGIRPFLKWAVLHQSPDKRGVPLPVKMVSQLTQTWHSQVRSFC